MRRADQVAGYLELIDDLAGYLCRITGYDAVRCSPTPGRKASSPACSPSAPITARWVKAKGTSV